MPDRILRAGAQPEAECDGAARTGRGLAQRSSHGRQEVAGFERQGEDRTRCWDDVGETQRGPGGLQVLGLSFWKSDECMCACVCTHVCHRHILVQLGRNVNWERKRGRPEPRGADKEGHGGRS